MVGIMSSSLKGYEGRSAVQTMDAGLAAGLDGVLFGNVLELSPDLDALALKAVATEAKVRNIRVGAGLGSFNPSKPVRNKALAGLGGGDIVQGLARTIDAVAALGTDTLFFVIGTIEDREDTELPWPSQLARVADALGALRPRLRDNGLRLLLKTHEELTTFEAVRLIEAVGSDVMGISHDPVNFLPSAASKTRSLQRTGSPLTCNRCISTMPPSPSMAIACGAISPRWGAAISTGLPSCNASGTCPSGSNSIAASSPCRCLMRRGSPPSPI